ncbi:hypothetical protein RC62_2141 [Flavobacterium aquidurense]|uniref:Uncharacterized protein n=1 Tax=Flavobacterium aquidurense TaxID=362413 RepID=A0A0Q1BEH6_9FLAO|nr:hypothetical protein RC62_2141 [Flavobacterium aquidurense]
MKNVGLFVILSNYTKIPFFVHETIKICIKTIDKVLIFNLKKTQTITYSTLA